MCKEKAIERAEEEAMNVLENYLQPFSKVKECFLPHNDTVEHFNAFLKEVGDTELCNKYK